MNKFSLLLLFAGLSTAVHANEVFNWKDGRGINHYSDVPRDMKPGQSNILNVRTHTVSTPAATAAPSAAAASGESVAEQQMRINQQIAAQNKSIEEQNKKIEADNRKQQEENCKTARLNRSVAESTRSNNREGLLARFDADIQKYCQ